MRSSWSISKPRTLRRTMAISILPHNEEAALADSSYPHIGSFEPTGFEPVVVQFIDNGSRTKITGGTKENGAMSSGNQMDLKPFIKRKGTHKCPERERI
jgi:hypothetical protein